jgi:hypothetical protein
VITAVIMALIVAVVSAVMFLWRSSSFPLIRALVL